MAPQKYISNKIIVLKEFWQSSNMVFGSFDCDYTHIIIDEKRIVALHCASIKATQSTIQFFCYMAQKIFNKGM